MEMEEAKAVAVIALAIGFAIGMTISMPFLVYGLIWS